MRVVRIPLRLKMGVSLLLLAIPLVALHIALVQRAPWWRLPHQDMAIASGLLSLVLLPIMYFIALGKNWALRTAIILSSVWVIISGIIALKAHDPALGFFSVFLICFAMTVFFWISKEMNRSYFDSGSEWYQGLPVAIPQISCSIGFEQSSERNAPDLIWKKCRIARIDEEGAFLFCDQAAFGRDSLPEIKKSVTVEMIFSHENRSFRCQGKPIRLLRNNLGVGLRFVGLTPDTSKELGDWVERLRGQGYVD